MNRKTLVLGGTKIGGFTTTPVNRKSREDVIIVPTVSDEEAEEKYPEGFKKIKPYLRTVKQPE